MVGAGPAGTSVALALLARGMEVTIVERRPGVGPRVCGAFLGAEALQHLDAFGLGGQVRDRGVPVPSVWVSVGRGKERRVSFPAPGLALSRTDLEQILTDAVRERGGKIRWGLVAKPADPSSIALSGQGLSSADPPVVRGDHVIWADGRFSRGPTPFRRNHPYRWFGWNAFFSGVSQKPGDMSLHFVRDGYVGVLTFKDGSTNICGLQRRRENPLEWEKVFRRAQDESESFFRRTQGATRLAPWRGVGPLPFRRAERTRGGFIRVGDAAAVGDPLMGEGIGRALAGGALLAQALDRRNLTDDARGEFVRSLWQSSYNKRFFIGTLFRWMLNRAGGVSQAMVFLLARSRLIDLLVPFFHKAGNGTVQGVECPTRDPHPHST